MASYNVLWKPSSQGQQNPGGASFLAPKQYQKVSVVDANGKVLEDLQPGAVENGTYKYYSRNPGSTYGQNVYIRADLGNGQYSHFKIPDASQTFGSMVDTNTLGQANDISKAYSLDPQANRTGTTGNLGRFTPGQIGPYGFYPAYMGNTFPKASLVNYKPIKTAPYNFTDPLAFGKEYGAYNRGEYAKNFELSKKFATDTLNTELSSLQHYTPATAALQREVTSADNAFNQAQRTAQIQTAMPGTQEALQAQAGRAASYAEGRLPQGMEDRALELGIRSAAADRATAGGFGVQSSAARKASDLLSATQRFQIGQYGEQLTSSNIAQQAGLNLAPTEYANAGSQIRVMPSLSASQLMLQNQADLNQYSMISATNALSSAVQQNQFATSLEQGTRQFNAQMGLGAQEFNANTKNQFSLAKFNYDVGYAGTVAGAAQTNVNAQTALDQQALAQQIAEELAKRTQNANTISSIGSTVASIISALKGSTSQTPAQTPTGTTFTPQPTPSASDIVGPNSPVVTGTNPPYQNPGSEPSPSTVTNPGPILGPVGSGVENNTPPSMISNPDMTTPDITQNPTPDFNTGYLDSEVQTYGRMAGINPAQLRSIMNPSGTTAAGDRVLSNSGVSNSSTPPQGMVQTGQYSATGKPISVNPALASDNTPAQAHQNFSNLREVLAPLGTEVSTADINSLEATSTNPDTLSQFNRFSAAGDSQGFVRQATSTFGNNVTTAMTASKVYDNWSAMSDGQKSLALASMATQGYRTKSGKPLGEAEVPLSRQDGARPINVNTALAAASLGVNSAELALNWGDITNQQRVLGTSQTAIQAIQTAQTTGLINNPSLSQNAGYAGMGLSAYQIYQNWGKMNNEQRGVAATQAAAAGYQATAGEAIPGVGYALAAYNLYQGGKYTAQHWGEGGTKNRQAGMRMTAGYTATGAMVGGPVGAIAGFVVGAVMTIGMSVKAGKSGQQNERDWFRGDLQKKGLYQKDAQGNVVMTMADGSVQNVGLDGKSERKATNPNELTDSSRANNLKPYDTDYTNDMDFAAGSAGVTLSRLIYGGRANKVDQTGCQIGNAMLGSVGYGAQMSRENFDHVMTNAKGVYAQAGIKSKEDGFALVSKALSEGRISNADAIGMQQSLNMIYDKNAYDVTTKAYIGRHVYAQKAQTLPPRDDLVQAGPSKISTEIPIRKFEGVSQGRVSSIAPATFRSVPTLMMSKEELRSRNRNYYAEQGVA